VRSLKSLLRSPTLRKRVYWITHAHGLFRLAGRPGVRRSKKSLGRLASLPGRICTARVLCFKMRVVIIRVIEGDQCRVWHSHCSFVQVESLPAGGFFTMFKFETVGLSLVIPVFLSLFSFAESASSPAITLNGGDPTAGCNTVLKYSLDTCQRSDPTCRDDAQKAYIECVKKMQIPKCDDASNEYSKAKGEFLAACSSAQLPSSTAGGHVGCSETLQKCSPVDGKSADDYESTGSSADLYDIEAEKRRMDECKLNAVTDHKGLKDDVKEARERKKDLKDKIPEIEKQISEAQQKATEDAEKIQQEETQENKDYAQKMKEAKRALEAEQNGLGDQVTGLQAQLDSLDEQIRQIQMQKTEANNKYEEALTNIDMSCQSSALQQVAKLQEIELIKIRDKRLPNHDFNSLMKRVGVSDRRAWQRVADDRYQQCMLGRSVKQTIQSAKRTRNTLLENADIGIAGVEKRKAAIRQQIQEIVPQSGCPNVGQMLAPNAKIPKMCQATQRAIEDQALASQEHQATLGQFTQKRQNAANNYTQNQARLAKQLQDAQLDLNEEQTRLTNLERYLSLKKKMSGGTTNVETKQIEDVKAKYGALITAASNVHLRCCSDDTPKPPGLCEPVKKFTEAIGRSAGADSPHMDSKSDYTELSAAEPQKPASGKPARRTDGGTGRVTTLPPVTPSGTGDR
jgi:hypothetical protein